MKINKISLKNYRNHEKKEISFENNTTVLIGNNGTGKTNILEAIYLLSTSKSKRARYDRDIIMYEQDFCTVNANVLVYGDEMDLEIQIIKRPETEHTSTKKVKVNKVPKSIQYFCGLFNSVLFTPEDINLLTGSPSERRKYVDMVLVQTDRRYKKLVSDYTKALKQRNKILEKIREENTGWDEIDFWTNQLVENGKMIQEIREDFFNDINESLKKYSKKLIMNDVLTSTRYKKSVINHDRLKELQNAEVASGTTLVGPHRDDFSIFFDGHDVAEFGSRGQQRSTLLALKFSEMDYIEKEKKERPVLLMDDIFSELDDNHQKAILETLENQQNIITTAEKLDFLEGFGFSEIKL